eukprot:4907653-Alexandrium_andersonii.AAC.1
MQGSSTEARLRPCWPEDKLLGSSLWSCQGPSPACAGREAMGLSAPCPSAQALLEDVARCFREVAILAVCAEQQQEQARGCSAARKRRK